MTDTILYLISSPEQGIDNDRLAFYRDRLINDLAGYSEARGRKAVVVFDARHSNNPGRTIHTFEKIKVIYSKRGETADTVIEEMVSRDRTHSKIFCSYLRLPAAESDI
ncbi:MAG: NYN domain-containing protein [Actinomycetota bacterium]|nr:NYN domain-containing protein [Actinomycetota bacterium]